VRPALAALAALVAVGCGVRAPELDPKEHVRGEHSRLLQLPRERVWSAVVAALDDEGLEVAEADEKDGTIATRPVRYAERDLGRRLAQIGDLSRVRGAGLGRISELVVQYFLLFTPAGEAGTSLKIRSAIEAIDRNDSYLFGPGIFPAVPRHILIPSRGVVERELMRRLAASLFSAEEMLWLLGEPGID
jgi:hypothetical protein